METDREILIWLHERLKHVYGESEHIDFMHRLRWIILATDSKKISRGKGKKFMLNSTDDLKQHLTEEE